MSSVQIVPNYPINTVYGTIAGCVWYSGLLNSGNHSYTISFNQTDLSSKSVHDTQLNPVYKMLTPPVGMSCDLPVYISNNIPIWVERISVDAEKINNIEKLDKIAKLEDGWDGGGAKAFSGTLIEKVRDILMGLQIQPELFPTACDTIQIEYEREDGSYLEVEISDDSSAKVFTMDDKGNGSSSVIESSIQEIDRVVKFFYGQ